MRHARMLPISRAVVAAALVIASLTAPGFAQTGTAVPAHKPSLLSRLLHAHSAPGAMAPHASPMDHPGLRSAMGLSGGIVGNKNTHVYHLPGDRGALPAPQNRVYFHTQAQAIAAGYHRAGAAHHGATH